MLFLAVYVHRFRLMRSKDQSSNAVGIPTEMQLISLESVQRFKLTNWNFIQTLFGRLGL